MRLIGAFERRARDRRLREALWRAFWPDAADAKLRARVAELEQAGRGLFESTQRHIAALEAEARQHALDQQAEARASGAEAKLAVVERLEKWLRHWRQRDILLFKGDLGDEIRADIDDGLAGRGGHGLQSVSADTLLAAVARAIDSAESESGRGAPAADPSPDQRIEKADTK